MPKLPVGPDSPWLLGALMWGMVSMVIIGEYRRIGGEPQQIRELWFLMSLLWGQFGFAALFADWRHNRARRFPLLLAFSLLPPLVLYLLIFGLA